MIQHVLLYRQEYEKNFKKNINIFDFQISNISVSDTGTYTCILSSNTTGDVSEEDVSVFVFERIDPEDGGNNFLDRHDHSSDVDFELKYLEYKVRENSSSINGTSYLLLYYSLFTLLCTLFY